MWDVVEENTVIAVLKKTGNDITDYTHFCFFVQRKIREIYLEILSQTSREILFDSSGRIKAKNKVRDFFADAAY